MLTAILISIAIIVFAGTLGGTLWLASHVSRSAQAQQTTEEAAKAHTPAFRWSYFMLPIAVLFLSAILCVFFYRQLPAEVATRFGLDGTPDRFISRQTIMVWALVPQLFLTLTAIGITWGISRMGSLFKAAAGTRIKPEQILLFIGNAIAVPQLVLSFAMLYIFSYNAYQQYIMPMWLFLLIILGLATIVLGMLSVLLFLKARRQLFPPANQTKE
jgi:uncharacterized membrane protein